MPGEQRQEHLQTVAVSGSSWDRLLLQRPVPPRLWLLRHLLLWGQRQWSSGSWNWSRCWCRWWSAPPSVPCCRQGMSPDKGQPSNSHCHGHIPYPLDIHICQIHNTISCYGDRLTLTTWSSSSRCDIVHFFLPAVSLTLSLSVWGACHLTIPHSLTHSPSLREVHAITQSNPQSLSVWGARHLIIPQSNSQSLSVWGARHLIIPQSNSQSLSVWGARHLIIPQSNSQSLSVWGARHLIIPQSNSQSLSVWGARHLIIPHSLTHSCPVFFLNTKLLTYHLLPTYSWNTLWGSWGKINQLSTVVPLFSAN